MIVVGHVPRKLNWPAHGTSSVNTFEKFRQSTKPLSC